jgi:hypothetical protein
MNRASRNRFWKVGIGGALALVGLALTMGGCPLFEDEFALDGAWFASDGWDWGSGDWGGGGDAGYNYSGPGGGIGSDGETFYFIDGDSSYISP